MMSLSGGRADDGSAAPVARHCRNLIRRGNRRQQAESANPGQAWVTTSSAAGVEAAAAARVAAAGALHHAAALLTGRPEVEAVADRRQHRGNVGHRLSRGDAVAAAGARRVAVAVARRGWERRSGTVAQLRGRGILRGLTRADLL